MTARPLLVSYSPAVRVEASDVTREDGSVIRPIGWSAGSPVYGPNDVDTVSAVLTLALALPVTLVVGDRGAYGVGALGGAMGPGVRIAGASDRGEPCEMGGATPSDAAAWLLRNHGPCQCARALAHAGFRMMP